VLQVGEQGRALERLVAERRSVGVVDGCLERRRAHVAVEDARVRMVEDRGLDAALEEHRRLAHEVLVESVLARDQYREAVPATTCASPLLT